MIFFFIIVFYKNLLEAETIYIVDFYSEEVTRFL